MGTWGMIPTSGATTADIVAIDTDSKNSNVSIEFRKTLEQAWWNGEVCLLHSKMADLNEQNASLVILTYIDEKSQSRSGKVNIYS